jgi:DNA-directed RNA polymerase subunit M/transcription elongation factor TFIIS
MKIVPAKYVCPRCKSENVYFAKRQVGQIGGIGDNPNSDFSPAFTRGIEQNVALCRDCGERMNLIHKEIKIAETEAEKQREKTKNNAFNWFMLLLFIILIAEIWYINSN